MPSNYPSTDQTSFTIYRPLPEGGESGTVYVFNDTDDYLVEYFRNRYEILFLKENKRLQSILPGKFGIHSISNHEVQSETVWPNEMNDYTIRSFCNGRPEYPGCSADMYCVRTQYSSLTDGYFNDYAGMDRTFTTYLFNSSKQICLLASRIYDSYEYQEVYCPQAPTLAELSSRGERKSWVSACFGNMPSGITTRSLSRGR
jgi:hypothetical protein